MADVERNTELLRAHARTAADLAGAAAAAVRGWQAHERSLSPTDSAELDRLVTSIRHAVAELTDAAAVLDAASEIGEVDVEVRDRVRRALAP